MHDPILERTLRQVRAERACDRRRRGGVVTVVGVALAAAVLAGGVHLGRHRAPGARLLVATAADGVRLTTTVAPADGWVRLSAVVAGVDAGERCLLVVTDVHGRRHVAGGWVAPRLGDTALAGAAVVGPDELAAVSVVTEDGRVLVTSTTRAP
ncbi:hypothetical protein [Saccharothrix luteola]|uniref:hypothetical protein n=1 Tax=Saccharothrix luteola TaxID=2893018 RepID=UPI001E2AE431|nr:hypothetical protein [Saccharothrix luteola]MCC8244156.1 hypothetical protein [Saccharothrix luteola]MCC8250878.1 hypothetical protein [Saccharothrix luteola]